MTSTRDLWPCDIPHVLSHEACERRSETRGIRTKQNKQVPNNTPYASPFFVYSTPGETEGDFIGKCPKNDIEATYASDKLYHPNERVVFSVRSSSELTNVSVLCALPLQHCCSDTHHC